MASRVGVPGRALGRRGQLHPVDRARGRAHSAPRCARRRAPGVRAGHRSFQLHSLRARNAGSSESGTGAVTTSSVSTFDEAEREGALALALDHGAAGRIVDRRRVAGGARDGHRIAGERLAEAVGQAAVEHHGVAGARSERGCRATHWLRRSAVSPSSKGTAGRSVRWRRRSAPRTGVLKVSTIGPGGAGVAVPAALGAREAEVAVGGERPALEVGPCPARRTRRARPARRRSRAAAGSAAASRTTRRSGSALRSRSQPPASRKSQRSSAVMARWLSTASRTDARRGAQLVELEVRRPAHRRRIGRRVHDQIEAGVGREVAGRRRSARPASPRARAGRGRGR